ncbi:MAG: CPBP family intramembrane glutamic endopeptidase [Gemmatimonadota bacterium]
MRVREYLDSSRSPRYSILFAVPLLVSYELLAVVLGDRSAGVRNGADVLLKSLFLMLGGHRGLLLFNVGLGALGVWLVLRDWRTHPGRLRPTIFAGMLLESLVLAVLVGVVVGRLTQALLHPLQIGGDASLGLGTQLMLSLGAGVYEELLFRVLLVGALAALGRRAFGWTPRGAGIFAACIGALIFSAFHYIGPFGDPLELGSFAFRAIAGLVFSGLYLTRGFGVTAWTHALYDVLVTLAA